MSCSDKGKEYYTLRPLYDVGGTLYTPVDNVRRQVRAVLSGEEARKLIDEKYLNMAERFLYGELAAALDMPKDEVKNYIIRQLDS